MPSSNKLKIINDPVYGFINLPSEDIYDLLQTIYLQRLRRIKQLGLSNMVYPGAEHTRFSHSIGAMYLMTKALQTLQNKAISITDNEKEFVLQAILLHDIGHAPFSHCLENFFFTCEHENLSKEFMRELKVHNYVIEIFEDTYKKHFLHQLVSSQIDIDRLDYLTRDSFFTGVSEGVIGTDRIMSMYNVKDDSLVIDEKGVYSIEKFIISRRLMYWQVYMHKTVVGVDCLLKNILIRAQDLAFMGDLNENECPISKHLSYFLHNGAADISDKEALNHFLLLDDTDIWSSVKIFSQHKDKILSFLSKSLISRNLGHVKIKNKIYSEQEINTLINQNCENHKNQGFSRQEIAKYFCVTNELRNRAYSFKDEGIDILFKNGEVKEIYKASDQLDKNFLSKEIRKYYYFAI